MVVSMGNELRQRWATSDRIHSMPDHAEQIVNHTQSFNNMHVLTR